MLHLLLFMAFTYYKTVTIDHTQCGASDSTDFPVTIWVTDADLKTVANGGKVQNSSGYDIRPYSDAGLTIALTYELVPSVYVATTGVLEMHVKIPTVSHTSDTLFYLAFGDSGISTDGSSTGTWDSNFLLVYHFANGSSLNINDSTGNANNLTNGSGTAATGLLDGGVTTAGLAPAATFGPITNFTWSAWGKTTDNSNYQVLVSRDPGAHETTMRLEIGTDHATLIYNYVTNPSQPTGSANLADGNWHFWEQAFDGTDATLRIDSSVIGTIASATSTTLNYVYLGVYDQSGAFPWGGTIDEFRVSQSFRSLDWGIAEYNNQKPSSTFLTFGALTPVGGASTDTTWFQRRGFPLMHYRPTWIQVP